MSPETYNFNRRSTLKAAGWSAPLVLASATVPAYAASSTTPPAELTANYGIFAQFIDRNVEDPFNTVAGVHTYEGNVTDLSGDSQYDTSSGSVTAVSGLAANGEGTFTPGGTVANNTYGGMGFWASAPYDSVTNAPVAGTTILAAGSVFNVTYRFTFNDSFAITSPLGWRVGRAGPYPAISDAPTSRLTHSNGARFTVAMSTPQVNGLVWTGRLTVTLNEDLVISRTGSSADLGQILASNHAVYHDMSEFLDAGEVTIAAATSAQLVLTAPGYDSKIISLTGQQVTASLPL